MLECHTSTNIYVFFHIKCQVPYENAIHLPPLHGSISSLLNVPYGSCYATTYEPIPTHFDFTTFPLICELSITLF